VRREFVMMPKVSWRVRAVVEKDSKEFAKQLETELNDGMEDGYMLANFISRESDGGMVCVMQKAESPIQERPVRGPVHNEDGKPN
jgi:hypothetical protein